MAKAVSVSNQGRQLVCSICQKTFEEMTISSCFHTFCLDCLRGQVSSFSGTSYRCPICKASVSLPREVIAQLRRGSYDTDGYVYPSALSQTCDICSDGKVALNRCMQCEESLCHACTNAHLKMKASRYHRQHVVPLTDQSAVKELERSRSQNYCWRHRNEEVQFFCKECDVLLCLICKLLEHEHHVTKSVSEEANDTRRRLASLLQKQVSLGEKLQMKIRETEARKSQYPLELDQQLLRLNYQASQMHSEIENEKQKAENELKQHYGDHLSRFKADEGQLGRHYEEYRAANSEVFQLLRSDNDVYVVGRGKLLCNRLNEIENDVENRSEISESKPSKHFQNGVIDSQQLHSMMGYVSEKRGKSLLRQPGRRTMQTSADRECRSPEVVSNLSNRDNMSARSLSYRVENSAPGKTESYSSFVTPYNDGIGYVYGIAPVDQNKAWITLLDHNSVLLLDTKGNVLSSVDCGSVCEDVAANSDSDCYVTCPGSKCIKHVSHDGAVEPIASELPQDPHGICLVQTMNTENGDIKNELYVCFTVTNSSSLSMYDNQKGCLRVFSEAGEDMGRMCLSQAPVRIDIHPDSSTLCVSDHSHGCALVTDLTGQFVKAIYTGESEEDVFKPLGVCFDSRGNVIVADWSGNRVSLISQEGVYMKTLVEDVDGPQTVAFRNGLLWVGSKHGVVNVYSLS